VVYYIDAYQSFKEIQMKLTAAISVIIVFLAVGCGSKSDSVTLKEGMAGYQLAVDLSQIVPEYAPGSGTVLAWTDDFEITSDEVIQAIVNNIGNKASQLTGIDAEQLKEVIEQNASRLAEQKLILNAARGAKTVVPEEVVESTLQQEYARVGGQEAFLEAINQEGIAFEHVQKNIRENLMINQFLMDVMNSQVEVTEEEVEAAYQADKTATVRHILLLTEEKSEEEKAEIYKKMEGLLARAKAGEDFAALATEYSEDPGSKDKGGLYENQPRGVMVPTFEEAMFTVPVGEISGIVETPYGYHIVKVIERIKEDRPLEEVRSELETKIRQQKMPQDFIQNYIENMKKEAGFQTVGGN
jgi:parvulin-like peptidyl-prolyl isomerase